MTKRIARIFLLAALTLSLGTLATVACKSKTSNGSNGGDEGTSSSNVPTKLLSPEISAQDGGIYWTSAKNASGYKICLNGGAWQNVTSEEKKIAYPTEVGEYTLQVVSTASGYTDSDAAKFSFRVERLELAECQQTDNVLAFTGDNVLCSVNDGGYAALPESQLLDFSSVAVGTDVSVTYYAKGGFWEEEDKTYYIDSATKSKTLTVTQTLSAPVLQLDEAKLGVAWTAVEHAANYQVCVDGVSSTVQGTGELFVAFPTTVGAHTITVKALENGNYKQSAESTWEMQTKEFGTPLVTYHADEQKIVWDERYAGYMLSSTGGEYTKVNAAQAEYTSDLSLKLASHYEADSNVFYLDSKALNFEIREVPTILFNSNGAISWNEEDEAQELDYYYSVGAVSEADSFARTSANSLDVSTYQVNTYKLQVYAAGYLEEKETVATLWLPSEVADITFSVLEAPALDFTTGKLLWEVDEKATSYQCKIGDGDEWITATKAGEFDAPDFTTYYVKAIGDATLGNYVVSSRVSQLYFDPSLQAGELAKFDDEKYLANVGTSLEGNTTHSGVTNIVSVGANDTEKAILAGSADGKVLKLTAGNAAPRVEAEWGNSDGFAFNFFADVDIDLDIYVLVIRMYMTSNPDRVNGKDGSGPANVEGLFNYLVKGKTQSSSGWSRTIAVDQWVDYAITLPATWNEPLQSLSINFHDNGKAGDAIYVDWIQLMDTRTTEKTIDFSAYTSVPSFVSSVRETAIVDGQLTNKTTLWNKESIVISYRELALKAGDTITVTATTVDNGMNIDLNGTYKKWVGANTTATVSIQIQEAMTLNTIAFRCSSAGGATYKIASVVIEEAAQVETHAPLSVDFSQYTQVPAFVTASKDVTIVDGTLANNEYKLYNNEKITIAYNDLSLKAGDTVTVRVELLEGNLNFDVNGTYISDSYYNTAGAITWTYTVTAEMTLSKIELRSSSNNGSKYKVSSIVITQV